MSPWLTRSALGWCPLAGVELLHAVGESLGEMLGRRLAVGIAGAALVGAWGLQLVLVAKTGVWLRLVLHRRWRLLAAVTFGLLLPLTLWASLVQWPTGDEPHYLLVVESLVQDRDFDIRNNHSLGHYRLFYPGRIEHAHALEGRGGRWFSKHSPGLPVLAVPFYLLAGRWGVVVLSTALASLLGVSLVRLCVDAGGGAKRAAHLAWWTVLSVPLLAYANQVFPAVIVALAVSEACRFWVASEITRGRAVWVLCLLGLVPWFHLGSGQLALPLLLALCVKATRQQGRLRVVCLLPCLLPALLVPFYLSTVGRIIPALGSYGSYQLAQLAPTALRLLADQEHGLLIHAPFWAGAVWGLGVAIRKREWLIPALLGAGYLVLLSCYNWWYGGWAPPGRFVLPVLPLIMVPLALARRCTSKAERLLGGWAVAVGLAVTAYPAWRYNAHDGSAAMLDSLGAALGVQVQRLFPSTSPVGFLLAGLYVAGFLWASWYETSSERAGGTGER
jgi:hypothetical protein